MLYGGYAPPRLAACRRGLRPRTRVLVAGAYPAPDLGCLLLGPPRPQTPGHFFLGEKVTKTPPGTPRTPFFVQSVSIEFDTEQPLKYRFASGSLVTSAAGVPLRLSPLGLAGTSCCAEHQMNLPL